VGNTAQAATTVYVSNLQPTWDAIGDGVYSAYYGWLSQTDTTAIAVSPGLTQLIDGKDAGIIKAGQRALQWDEGLFGFKPNDVTINTLATTPGALTYNVENQNGSNPVWMTIEIDTGAIDVAGVRIGNTVYQFVPTPYTAGWHTVFAGTAGQWQLMDANGNGVGDIMSLVQVAELPENTGRNVVRVYLRLGMGPGYLGSGSGTVAYVDKVTIGDTTYDFVVAAPVSVTSPSLGLAETYGIVSKTYTNSLNAGLETAIVGNVCYTTEPTTAPKSINGATETPCPSQVGLDQASALADLNAEVCTSIGTDVDLDKIIIGSNPPGTFPPGCYESSGTMDITLSTTVTLDATAPNGDGGDTWIFRSGGALTTGANSIVKLTNGASADNVFWTPRGAASIGANSSTSATPTFVGTIIADALGSTGINLGHFVNLAGRALAFGHTVTTDSNTITASASTARAATFTLTGGTGTHNGITYQGYALTVTADGTSIPLNTTDIMSMTVLNPDGTTTTLPPVTVDSDPLLWFNVARASGNYVFTITTANGTVYTATINHTQDAAAALAAYKVTKLGELATAFGTYSSGNYTAENWTTLSGFDTAGIAAINNATDLAGVDSALATATTGMSGVAIIPQHHGNSGSSATPAVPAKVETPDGCAAGNKFSTTTGRNCNAATPAVPAGQVLGASTGPIPGCGNRTTGFSVATGESCIGNSVGKVLGAEKFNFTKFLKFKAGSYKVSLQGAEVIELQKLLTSLGYDVGIADGKFGPKTKEAVIKFQIANSLEGDGVVGALTRAVLNK